MFLQNKYIIQYKKHHTVLYEGKLILYIIISIYFSEVLLKMHRDNRGNPITEKEVFGAFGSSLNNAKDWDGYRSQRKEKEKKAN
jgi:hypothetical protein